MESALKPGDVFAGYTIQGIIGTGGMGAVYLARHPNLPRLVALKLLHRSLTGDNSVRARFEHEAAHAARLEHPNIVAVYDRGRVGDQLWIAMQYVAGTDAGKLVARGPVPPQRALHIITEVAKALDHAHRLGILHRDVKPANILLAEGTYDDADERVFLTDFGIAKALDETGHLTQTGILLATLHYASPEQLEGRPLDGRSDVYSLGCTLYHLVTGHPPYEAPSAGGIIMGHVSRPIPRPTSFVAAVPPAFDDVIARALAKNRDERYSTCMELATAARHAAQFPRRPAPEPTVLRDQVRPPTPQPWQHQPVSPAPSTSFLHRPIAAVLAVLVAIACVVGFAIWRVNNQSSNDSSADAAKNPGNAFQGMYNVKIQSNVYNGVAVAPDKLEKPLEVVWEVRSQCDGKAGECVAVASSKTPGTDGYFTLDRMEFRYTDGRWVRNFVPEQRICRSAETQEEQHETWVAIQTITLTAPTQPTDGPIERLSGKAVTTQGGTCRGIWESTMDLVRSGDLPADTAPLTDANPADPGNPNPPGAAFRGTYELTTTLTSTPPGSESANRTPVVERWTASPACTHDGNECVVVLSRPETDHPRVFKFVDGAFEQSYQAVKSKCDSGVDAGNPRYLDVLKPTTTGAGPAQKLTGTTTITFTGACPGVWKFTIDAVRIGE
ncbi:serine/threonine-protein kinase [Antrihabitans stalactiti]|uniref:non-specific serine/threonine protein kinase n=1 Tax=Antrihabitans stalactiti TaxID=2584121 RepID=A0A848KJX8_9NOCA|nr:serine/threonine-protein kinase [Antrihabitans stalactiti]NMN98158.1 serine/threonine protein kinase [Antrihabitans stalactiti]